MKAYAKGHVQRFTYRRLRTMLRRQGLRPVRWQYSYHILGQLWDFWYYYARSAGAATRACRRRAADRARRLRWRLMGRAFGLLQRLGYWESRLLANVPLAMAVDFACRKVRRRS